VPGVAGQALQRDGIAVHVVVPAASVPGLAGSFTVDGWVALGAYPFSDAPILQQQDGEAAWCSRVAGDDHAATAVRRWRCVPIRYGRGAAPAGVLA
jgi:hypothetical protein